MLNKAIAFQRDGYNIFADVLQVNLEPGTGDKYQLVYFAKDIAGRKYRVPKTDVIIEGRRRKKWRQRRGRD